MFIELIKRYPELAPVSADMKAAYELLAKCFESGNRLFICGNGGSASDSLHISGELLKSFKIKRSIDPKIHATLCALGERGKRLAQTLEGALPAISLVGEEAFSTAFSNDALNTAMFAQRLYALGQKGDVLLALSTSGNSENCLLAAELARAAGISVISLTGKGGGEISKLSDICIAVPEHETYKVQELHLPIYHALCAALEEHFFG
jgi:D-sedoheptulose 7-phosphate isomerase